MLVKSTHTVLASAINTAFTLNCLGLHTMQPVVQPVVQPVLQLVGWSERCEYPFDQTRHIVYCPQSRNNMTSVLAGQSSFA